MFGVIRRDALHGTALIADHVGADRTLLIELALRGRFAGVPEMLFVNRDHPERFTRRNKTLRAQAEWYAPAARRGGFCAPGRSTPSVCAWCTPR